ncbi:MAG: hypothetical protein CM1200mP39_20440 [Dehalococcoidia bacterium]|nr:MAG: hypothetical protein CM1200mP39_20440 [Dehalococcoidia bacterium]
MDIQLRKFQIKPGISGDRIEKAARHFANHTPAVAFGGGSAGAHTNGSFNLEAIYALNILVNAVDASGGITPNPKSAIDGLPISSAGAPFQHGKLNSLSGEPATLKP